MFLLPTKVSRLEYHLKPIWVRDMDMSSEFHFGPVVNPFPVFWYVLQGKRFIQIGSDVLLIQKGDLVVFSPGVPYQLLHSDNGQAIRYLSLGCTIKVGPFDLHKLYSLPNVTSFLAKEDTAAFINGWMKMIFPFNQLAGPNAESAIGLRNSLFILELQGLLYQWFAKLLTLLDLPGPDPLSTLDPRIIQACSYVQEHVHEVITLERWAAHVYLSQSHFSQLFRQTLMQSPMQYLRAYRMQLAKDLLARSPQSISEIARQIGYAELSEFSRSFKNLVGCSPQAYRRQWQSGVIH